MGVTIPVLLDSSFKNSKIALKTLKILKNSKNFQFAVHSGVECIPGVKVKRIVTQYIFLQNVITYTQIIHSEKLYRSKQVDI